MTHKTKIALIGFGGCSCHTEEHALDSYAWEEISRIENLRDYDNVVLNVLGDIKKKVDRRVFSEKLNVGICMEMLASRSQFVIIGDPRFNLAQEGFPMQFLEWTGHILSWDNKPGDTKEVDKECPEYVRSYIEYLDKWRYSLKSFQTDSRAAESFASHFNFKKAHGNVNFRHRQLCCNRYYNSLAFTIQAEMNAGKGFIPCGSITFLPATSLPEDESILAILDGFYGLKLKSIEPEWLQDLTAPGQESVDLEKREKETQLDSLRQELDSLTVRRKELREPLKLLYSSGIELEQVVRKVLGYLGASVENPVESDKEDGWISFSIGSEFYEGVLEVKGTEKPQHNENGLRQLMEWRALGVTKRQKRYKGIFVGNSSRSEPLEVRQDPFGSNWIKSAALDEIVALKAEDPYKIYEKDQKRELDRDAFWKELFTTNGVFDASEFLE